MLFPTLAVEQQLKRNEILFHRGDEARAIFRVLDGRLRLLRNTIDGQMVTLHVAKPNDYFAEASLFAEHYHCDAVADLPSRVALYPRQVVLKMLLSEPATALRFAALQAQRIQALRTQLELRNLRSARERIWQYLLLSADAKTRSIVIERPLKDMASDIGLSHESFYRSLAALEKAGDIIRTGNMIQIISTSLST